MTTSCSSSWNRRPPPLHSREALRALDDALFRLLDALSLDSTRASLSASLWRSAGSGGASGGVAVGLLPLPPDVAGVAGAPRHASQWRSSAGGGGADGGGGLGGLSARRIKRERSASKLGSAPPTWAEPSFDESAGG